MKFFLIIICITLSSCSTGLEGWEVLKASKICNSVEAIDKIVTFTLSPINQVVCRDGKLYDIER